MKPLRSLPWGRAALAALLLASRAQLALGAPAPAAAAGDDSLLAAALVVAEKVAVPRMLAEKNLTAQSDQLSQLARLYARAGRLDRAVQMVRGLDAPDRVKAPALAQIAIVAREAGDGPRADSLIRQLSAMEEWTAPIALAAIARALHSAGDSERALRLASQVGDPLAQAKLYLEMGGPARLRDALGAASQIAPGSEHVLRQGGAVWQSDFSARQESLLEVVGAAVDGGDLDLARQALQALGAVPDGSRFQWRARALLEIARGERSAGKPDTGTLQQALAEVEAAQPGTMGDLRAKVDLLATLAGRLGGEGAVQLLARAADLARQAEAVPEPKIRDSFGSEMLARLAVAWADLGHPAEALELLTRAARIADAMAVPAAGPGRGRDTASSARHDRIEAQARVAAGFEQAGQGERGAALLARAVADIRAIDSEEWREYAWRAIVEAYAGAGRLDRALEILGSQPSSPDRFLAIRELAERLPTADLVKLAPLLGSLPASFLKTDLAAGMAAQLAQAGRPAEAAELRATALSGLAARPRGWEFSLIRLANEAPEAARPGDAEQRKVLRGLLRGL